LTFKAGFEIKPKDTDELPEILKLRFDISLNDYSYFCKNF